MIGAFYQPKAVVIDTQTLSTLPAREVAAGLAEVIKYGLIRDVAFFEWLEAHIDELVALNSEALAEAIERSCACKAEVVAADEREGGVRAILNLGHTFGHAIETHMGYGNWLHGEAVAAGMMMAARLSQRKGALQQSDVDRIEALLRRVGLPTSGPEEMPASRYRELMAVDKKVMDGGLRLVLLRRLGDAEVTADFRDEDLEWVLNA